MNVRQFTRELFARIKSDWYMPVTEHQIYDTTERVIGTYMGKPLYRKTLTGLNIAMSWIDTQAFTTGTFDPSSFGVTDVDTVVLVNGSSTTNHAPKGYVFGVRQTSATSWTLLGMDDIACNILTLEYTKTTDAASESKVPFEPLTEYSTEERMIGYWIDGKPLYRKVWSDLTIPSGNNDTKIPLGDQNIDMIVRVSTSSKMGAIENPPLSYDTGGNNQALQVFIGTGGSLFVRMRGTALSQYTGKKISVILEYTKTTD